MTKDACSVRRLTAADLSDYKALRDAMLALHPEAFTSDAAAESLRPAESYRARLGIVDPTGADFTLGAWQLGMLVGAVACERETRTKVRHTAHLLGMMVRPEARGLGLGRALLDEYLRQARKVDGLQIVTLSVTAGNAAATSLYERAGFVRYGTLPRAIRVGDTYFAKDLMALAL